MKLRRMSVGFLSLLLMASCGKKQDASNTEAPASVYPTSVINKSETVLEAVYPVTIKGQEDIEIKPRIDGFIEAIYVDEGAVVRKGQALFKINSPNADQAVNSAQAALNSATAQVNTAKLNVDRFRPLAEKGIVSEVQLATYKNAYESALATQAQAQATLTNALATRSWTNVTSPVDGVIGSIPYRLGSLVNSSVALTTVANISSVYAYFSLNEKEVSAFLNTLEGNTQAEKIKNAPEITLTLADGTVYEEKGKLETITGSINITTGSANFRASFPNKSGHLRSGTSGKIAIPRVFHDAFVIPQKATFAQQDKVLVYKVQGDSVVQKIISVLPTPDGKSYVVTDGISDGDKIVTDGLLTLSQGSKIREN